MKLKYFSQHGWASEWTKMAEEIVWDEYLKYDTLEESVTKDVCAPFILCIIILMSPA